MIKINSILLRNFRRYSNESFNFGNNKNVIIGNNASGKTSLVEAIGLIGTCRSFRTSNDKEMIKNGQENYYISLELQYDDETRKISFAFDGKNRKIVENNKTIKTISEIVGKYKVVTFTPEDVRIITGDPKIRRKFLDSTLSMIDKEYLNNIIIYNKVLKERNELLKQDNVDETLLKVYTEKMVQTGEYIIKARRMFIDNINKHLNDKVQVLSNYSDISSIIYKPNVDVEYLDYELMNGFKHDIRMQTTCQGPHRDDFVVMVNKEPCVSYGSQGQIKTIILGIKLSVVEIIKEINDNIIIILDDVFGELDETRQNQILKLINDDYQVFITTTHISNIDKEILQFANIINVDERR